jgi:hypothetical protein
VWPAYVVASALIVMLRLFCSLLGAVGRFQSGPLFASGTELLKAVSHTFSYDHVSCRLFCVQHHQSQIQ